MFINVNLSTVCVCFVSKACLKFAFLFVEQVNPFKQTLTMLEKIFSVSKRASLCEEPSREMLGDLAGDLAEIAAMHDTM